MHQIEELKNSLPGNHQQNKLNQSTNKQPFHRTLCLDILSLCVCARVCFKTVSAKILLVCEVFIFKCFFKNKSYDIDHGLLFYFCVFPLLVEQTHMLKTMQP